MKIIDLTKKIKDNMEVYKGDPKVEIFESHNLNNDGFRLKTLKFGSHTGTHVDSFSHMVENGKTLDEIPLDRFLGKAVCLSPKDSYPSGYGFIFNEKVNEEYFEKIKNSNPNFVGGDLSFELEKLLLENEIITFTDLINLEKLPRNKEFLFIGLPLNIYKGDGSPIRAVAIIDTIL